MDQAKPPELIEIRIHGVGGTTPAAMLGRSDLVQVSGDANSGFYRSPNQAPGRATEAYSWGAMTAKATTRALWALLLPFSLVNLAGWMIEPARERQQKTSPHRFFRWLDQQAGRLASILPNSTSGRLAIFQSWLVHLLGLLFTATYVQLAAFVAVDLLAYQCGGNEECRVRLPVANLLNDRIGRRLVLGMALPIGLLILFLVLARRSRFRYEAYRPTESPPTTEPSGMAVMEDASVWDRVGFQTCAARLHISGAVGGLLITLSAMIRQLQPDGSTRTPWIEVGLWVGIGLAALSVVVIVWLAARPARADSGGWNATTLICYWLAWVALANEMRIVWGMQLPVDPDLLTSFAYAPLLLLAAAIVIGSVLAISQTIRWVAEKYLHTDQFAVPVAALLAALWPRPITFAGIGLVLMVLNMAAPTDGRRTGKFDLALLAPVVGGLGLLIWLKEPGYLWGGVVLTAGAAAFVWLARRPEMGFRWAGAGALSAFAAIVLLGTFSGVIVRLAAWLKSEDFNPIYPSFYRWSVVAVTGSLLVVLFGLGLFGLRTVLINRRQWSDEINGQLPAAGFPQGENARRAVARKAVLFRGLSESVKAVDVVITMAGMILFAAGVAGVTRMWHQHLDFVAWFDPPFPDKWLWLVDLSAWLALATVAGAYLVVRSGLRNEAIRRKIGIVWDVASFFPRFFHPLAPPAYAARAVPEIQARIRETIDRGGRVVLAGHSQGSVLAAAALASLPGELTRRTALVTYGSPIGRFYRRYFPGVFDLGLVERLGTKVGRSSPAAPLCWINFYRTTDPIGSPTFTEGELSTLAFMPEVMQSLRDYGRSAVAGDVMLGDPWESELNRYRPFPKLRLHSLYESDPAWLGVMERIGPPP